MPAHRLSLRADYDGYLKTQPKPKPGPREDTGTGMRCTACGGPTRVLDSRLKESGAVMRRRRCIPCRYRFTTFERAATDAPYDPATAARMVASMLEAARQLVAMAQALQHATETDA